MKKTIYFSLVRPGGNDTALVDGLFAQVEKKKINDLIMKKFPKVEQVGFYSTSKQTGVINLEMAGGEFCGNALRSLAFILLDKKPGKISVNFFGISQKLNAGVRRNNNAFAQMPILNTPTSRQMLTINIIKVELDGITHLLANLKDFEKQKNLKITGEKLLEKFNLKKTCKASGVIFFSKEENVWKIEPIVWVRKIKTLFYETSCASGSTALALWQAEKSKNNVVKFLVKQPSGKSLLVVITKEKNMSVTATIEGSIELIGKEKIQI